MSPLPITLKAHHPIPGVIAESLNNYRDPVKIEKYDVLVMGQINNTLKAAKDMSKTAESSFDPIFPFTPLKARDRELFAEMKKVYKVVVLVSELSCRPISGNRQLPVNSLSEHKKTPDDTARHIPNPACLFRRISKLST